MKANTVLINGFKKTKHNAYDNDMTLGGTKIKALILVILVALSAFYSYFNFSLYSKTHIIFMGIAVVIGMITALMTSFIPLLAPITSPLYAVSEGVVLGVVSQLVNQRYPGVVFPAILLTIAISITMLLIYRAVPGIGARISKFVIIATLSIGMIYLLTFVLALFGVSIPYIHSNGPIGIAFTAIVLIIAALNLIVDFEFINQSVRTGAPKYMEWYAAFGLTVTLVWIYLKVLELITKIIGKED